MAKNWIKGAVKHPGALHRMLDIPVGTKLTADDIDRAMKMGGVAKKRAQLAKTLKGFNH